jgi:23S rRNA (cytosine1962-C5)-methyltransferase
MSLLDTDPLAATLRRELGRRAGLGAGEPLEGGRSRRLFHGRGKVFTGLEALTVDWFSPVALAVLFDKEAERLVPDLIDSLCSVLGDKLEAVVVQRRYQPNSPSETVWGVLPEKVYAVEEGLKYELRLGASQNVGFFLDMALGRALVAALCPGRRVLNLFSYTCSFSVTALIGGAHHVVNLDMNRGALKSGRVNHELNALELRRASFLPHDLFKSFGKLQRLGPFDLIIVDPPEQQGASFGAVKDWPRLVRKLAPLAAPGCDILAALNSPTLPPSFITGVFANELPGAALVRTFGAPPDDFPESEPDRGLKLFHFRVE